jgi:hypothetical protein
VNTISILLQTPHIVMSIFPNLNDDFFEVCLFSFLWLLSNIKIHFAILFLAISKIIARLLIHLITFLCKDFGTLWDNPWVYLLGRDCNHFVSPNYVTFDPNAMGTTASGQLVLKNFNRSIILLSPFHVPMENNPFFDLGLKYVDNFLLTQKLIRVNIRQELRSL